MASDTAGVGAELARRMAEEVWTQGRIEVLDEILAPDFRAWDPAQGSVEGPEDFRNYVTHFRSVLSDIDYRIDLLVTDGEWVAQIVKITAKHTGELLGRPATGREVTIWGTDFSRVVDGRIVEARGIGDLLGLMQQIGAVGDVGSEGEWRE